jgi:hypothetical protein
VESCPNCFYDIISETSDGQFNTGFVGSTVLFVGTTYERTVYPIPFSHICPVCQGKGNLTIPNEKTIKAHVVWEMRQDQPYTPAGDLMQDTVSIKADSKYYDDLMNAQYLIVDGKKVTTDTTPIIRRMGGPNEGIVEVLCVTVKTSGEAII